MTQINPLQGSILQTSQAQKIQDDSKAHHARMNQQMRLNSAVTQAPEDIVDIEVPVENAEELKPIQDHGQDARQRKSPRHRNPDDDKPNDEDNSESHLDLTA